MKYYILLIIPIFISCKRCKDKEKINLPQHMETYFGMYKPGNWWVYQNQDGLKTDCLYVENFNIRHIHAFVEPKPLKNGYKKSCESYEAKSFKLFIDGESHDCFYSFDVGESIGGPYFRLIPFANFYLDLYSNVYYSRFQHKEIIPTKVDNYDSVICSENNNYGSCFAPNIGLIKFYTQSDTFSLVRYNIIN